MSEPEDGRPDLGAAAVRGVRWSMLARPLIEVVLFGSMIVLARLISPAEFGRFAIALIVTELALFIPTEGVGSALVQRKELTRAHLQTGFALTLIAGVLLAGLTLALAGSVIDPLFGARTAELVRMTIPAFLIGALATVPSALLRRRLAFGTLSVVEITSVVVRAAVGVGLAVAGLDAEALVYAVVVSMVVAATMVWVAAPAPLPRLHVARAREILEYGLPASLASISWVGFRNCDYALVGVRLGAAQAGYYFRAYSLAVEYQKKVSSVMGMLAFPVLSRTADPDELARVRTQMVRAVTIVLFPVLVGLAILAPAVIPWVFGPAWEPAVLPTQILALGGAATLVSDVAGSSLMAMGRTRALLGYGWAHFLVYAVLVYLFAPLGLAAVAIVAAVVHAAFLWVAYALMLRGSGQSAIRLLWRDAGPAAVSCLAFAAAAVPANVTLAAAGASPIELLLVVGATGGVAYAVALRLLFPDAWATVVRLLGRVLPSRGVARLRRLVPASARPGS